MKAHSSTSTLARRGRAALASGLLALMAINPGLSLAADASAPDTLIRQLSQETVDAIKADKAIQAGDLQRIVQLVDEKIMPHVDFDKTTKSAVGRHWNQATPEQRERLKTEFKGLLLRVYAGALSQFKDQTIRQLPLRPGAADGGHVEIKTQIVGKGEPLQLNYSLEKSEAGVWKIWDFNVLGASMVQTYRNPFAQEVSANGIDGLIKMLAEKNKKPLPAKA
jgi:phospholipid transport system substrate-binding protein